ncbi:MAG TPA: hypothetical protein PK306_04310 [Aquabacterium sp.]|nr:hypothetical protein [Aquabacterium sp.]
MSHKKRLQAFRNGKLCAEQGEKIRVEIKLSEIRCGDGVNGAVEDYMEKLKLAADQFYMETAGMGLIGTLYVDKATKHYIQSARVDVDPTPAHKPARSPASPSETQAATEPVDVVDRTPAPAWRVDPPDPTAGGVSASPEPDQTPTTTSWTEPSSDPLQETSRRELALQQALKLLEDFKEGHLTYREDVVARIEESAWPELVHSIVTKVNRKFVTQTADSEIRWKAVSRIPDALPTRQPLELLGTVVALKKEGKGIVRIKVDEVVSEQHAAAIHALCRKGTGPVSLPYTTDAVRRRLSLFDSTPHPLRFKGSAAKGLTLGDRFEFSIDSVELANPDEDVLRDIEQLWHEELHRK